MQQVEQLVMMRLGGSLTPSLLGMGMPTPGGGMPTPGVGGLGMPTPGPGAGASAGPQYNGGAGAPAGSYGGTGRGGAGAGAGGGGSHAGGGGGGGGAPYGSGRLQDFPGLQAAMDGGLMAPAGGGSSMGVTTQPPPMPRWEARPLVCLWRRVSPIACLLSQPFSLSVFLLSLSVFLSLSCLLSQSSQLSRSHHVHSAPPSMLSSCLLTRSSLPLFSAFLL